LSNLLGYPVGAADRRSPRRFRWVIVVLGGNQRVELFRMTNHPLRPVFFDRTGPERTFLDVADDPQIVGATAPAKVQGSGLMVAIRAPFLAQRIDLATCRIKAAVKLPAAPHEAMGSKPQRAGVAVRQGRPDHKGGFHFALQVILRRTGSFRNLLTHMVDQLTRRHRSKNETAVQVPEQPVASNGLLQARVVCRERRQRAEGGPDGVRIRNIEGLGIDTTSGCGIGGCGRDRHVLKLFAQYADR
jgi:hypothetical protein